jgi:hypothetical protein
MSSIQILVVFVFNYSLQRVGIFPFSTMSFPPSSSTLSTKTAAVMHKPIKDGNTGRFTGMTSQQAGAYTERINGEYRVYDKTKEKSYT